MRSGGSPFGQGQRGNRLLPPHTERREPDYISFALSQEDPLDELHVLDGSPAAPVLGELHVSPERFEPHDWRSAVTDDIHGADLRTTREHAVGHYRGVTADCVLTSINKGENASLGNSCLCDNCCLRRRDPQRLRLFGSRGFGEHSRGGILSAMEIFHQLTLRDAANFHLIDLTYL
jgi:hypothetical protein